MIELSCVFFFCFSYIYWKPCIGCCLFLWRITFTALSRFWFCTVALAGWRFTGEYDDFMSSLFYTYDAKEMNVFVSGHESGLYTLPSCCWGLSIFEGLAFITAWNTKDKRRTLEREILICSLTLDGTKCRHTGLYIVTKTVTNADKIVALAD